MIKMLRWALGLCTHEWEEAEQCNISIDGRIVTRCYVLRCKRCGDLKTKNWMAP